MIEEIWMFLSPFSKRETVGALTPANRANFCCVRRCALRLCLASSTIIAQLI